MPIEHLPATAKPEQIAEALDRDGCAVVDGLASSDLMQRFREEMAPYIDATRAGGDGFSGKQTQRTGALIARSPAAREMVGNATVLGTAKNVLSHSTNFQLHLTQVIAIGPGESAQSIHRDRWAFDFFPFPDGYEVQCNTMWALTDFTEENGATRVIPGSHRLADKLKFKHEDTEPAEMKAGSVLFYTGSIYHGGGANQSDAVRMGANITYNVAWLRQEENQYLSVPREVAKDLPDSLLRLMGYAQGAYALGYIDDLRDPIEALGRKRPSRGSFGDVEDVDRHLERG